MRCDCFMWLRRDSWSRIPAGHKQHWLLSIASAWVSTIVSGMKSSSKGSSLICRFFARECRLGGVDIVQNLKFKIVLSKKSFCQQRNAKDAENVERRKDWCEEVALHTKYSPTSENLKSLRETFIGTMANKKSDKQEDEQEVRMIILTSPVMLCNKWLKFCWKATSSFGKSSTSVIENTNEQKLNKLSLQIVQINKWDGSQVKHAIDDAFKCKYPESFCWPRRLMFQFVLASLMERPNCKEHFSIIDGRLFICALAVGVSLFALGYDYIYTFPTSKFVIASTFLEDFLTIFHF